MDALTEKVDKAVKLVQNKGCGYMEAIEKLRKCKLDNNGELYDPVSGETFKDIDALTPEEVKIFVEG